MIGAFCLIATLPEKHAQGFARLDKLQATNIDWSRIPALHTTIPSDYLQIDSSDNTFRMEDLPGANSSPVVDDGPLPEGNNDHQDPLAPEIEEESSSKNPPIADPGQDLEATEDTAPDVPDRDDGENYNDDDEDEARNDDADNADNHDDDSDALSEVDEAQFDDFDANAIAIEERPRVVDANGVALLGKHKRKRDVTEGEEGEKKKKRKEGRREKPKRSKKRADAGEDDFNEAAESGEGGRRKKKRGTAEDGEAPRRRKRTPSVERDELLTPEEREYHSFILSSYPPINHLHDRPQKGILPSYGRRPCQTKDIPLPQDWYRSRSLRRCRAGRHAPSYGRGCSGRYPSP